MISYYKKFGRTIIDLAVIGVTIFLVLWLFSYMYSIAAPFFYAFFIFLIIEPFAQFLRRKGVKAVWATSISAASLFLLVVGTLTVASAVLATEVYKLIEVVPTYIESFREMILNQMNILQIQIEALPPDVLEKIKEYTELLSDKVSDVLKGMLLALIGGITSLSKFFVNFVLGSILAFFLSVEIEEQKKWYSKKAPKSLKKAIRFLRENVVKGLSGYVKAQLKLISVTFIIVLISLFLLNVENAFTLSILAAVLDLLPLLGISTLFVPWIIYLFVTGNVWLGGWLLGVFLLLVLFRQIAEPKLTGDSLGVSAFVMLAFMIVSLSVFGVAGLIVSPVLLILLKALMEEGYIRRWIYLPKDEFEREEELKTEAETEAEK